MDPAVEEIADVFDEVKYMPVHKKASEEKILEDVIIALNKDPSAIGIINESM